MSDIQAIREPDRTEEFWQTVEQAHGKVLAFSLTQYSFADSDINNALLTASGKHHNTRQWGICYGTESALYFHHFQQNSMLGSLLGQQKNKEFCISLPFASLESWHFVVPAKKGVLQSLKKKERTLAIRGIAEDANKNTSARAISSAVPKKAGATSHSLSSMIGKNYTHLFYLDFQESDILQLLRMIIPNKEQSNNTI